MNGVPEIVGGIEDHVHLLASLRTTHRLSDVVRDLKKDSTNWIRDNFDRRFTWQEGYAVFTVSPSKIGEVHDYIAAQHIHHAKRAYIDELKGLLVRAGIEYDERYLL
jgi:REP element-mobilizing transposase RayT